jgi:hypothetical protein
MGAGKYMPSESQMSKSHVFANEIRCPLATMMSKRLGNANGYEWWRGYSMANRKKTVTWTVSRVEVGALGPISMWFVDIGRGCSQHPLFLLLYLAVY